MWTWSLQDHRIWWCFQLLLQLTLWPSSQSQGSLLLKHGFMSESQLFLGEGSGGVKLFKKTRCHRSHIMLKTYLKYRCVWNIGMTDMKEKHKIHWRRKNKRGLKGEVVGSLRQDKTSTFFLSNPTCQLPFST